MAFAYKTTIYKRNLQAQFQVGGQGYRWLDRVKLAMHRAAVAGAPMRAGTIKRSHNSYIRGINQWACAATISNSAPHAEFVHEGTTGPITPTDAPYLRVPIARGATRRFNASSVRGQAANPWLARACGRVAARRGAVPIG